MDLERLGAALRERREALGIPRTEVARRVGVTPTYIWLVEGAKPRKGGEPSRPTQAVLERWMKALGMDDRYTRRALALAGYTTPDEERRSAPLTGSVPSTVAPQAPVRRFAMRPMAQARMDGPPDAEDVSAVFARAPLHFQQPRDLRSEVLLDSAREVLRLAEASEARWEETAELLESFLDWLRFRLERELLM